MGVGLSKTSDDLFIYKPNSKIGSLSAEEDQKFLNECFVELPCLEAILDPSDPTSILLGRTGSGKSAIVQRIIATQDNVIELDPEALAFNYVANSSAIQAYGKLGVDFDPFFRLLWQHIISVELLRSKFHINDEASQRSFLSRLQESLSSRKKKDAIEYFRTYGDDFWLESGVRAREITTTFLDKIKSHVGISGEIIGAGAGVGGERNVSEQERVEIVTKVQRVVDDVQIRQLANVIDYLQEDVFTDPKNVFYLVIDNLDTNFAVDAVKFRLLGALIESLKKFRKVKALQIVITMRADVFERITREVNHVNFQSNKFRDYTAEIKWSRPQLEELVDLRIASLFREKYTGKRGSISTILPPKIRKETILSYLFERTFLRPRDTIDFLNTVLDQAVGKGQISETVVNNAEGIYSSNQLTALKEEWSSVFPNVSGMLRLLEGMKDGTEVKNIPRKMIETAVEILATTTEENDPIVSRAQSLYEPGSETHEAALIEVAKEILSGLYLTGAVGVKPGSKSSTQWAQSHSPTISPGEMTGDSKVYVHKSLHRSLGITPIKSK